MLYVDNRPFASKGPNKIGRYTEQKNRLGLGLGNFPPALSDLRKYKQSDSSPEVVNALKSVYVTVIVRPMYLAFDSTL